MSVSRVVLGTALAIVVLGVSGCQVQVKTKTRFVEPNVTTPDAVWNGEPIEVNIQGVGFSVNGGVNLTADPNATSVKATADFLGSSFNKADADLSIVEAKATFSVSNVGGKIVVACGHGGSHGDSNGGESGCQLVTVTIPAGSAAKPLDLTVLGGNGTMTMQLAAATIKNVGANNKGDINAQLPVTVGANISLVSPQADDIFATMPANWAANEVIINADAAKIFNSFADVKLGAGAGGRGTPGTGLGSLKLTSSPFAGSSGEVTLR